jgi:uncharacterized RmlC-like cupin family protein
MATVPHECTIKSGEIIYVPATFRHAIINTADSIGVAFQGPWEQKHNAASLLLPWKDVLEGDPFKKGV